MADVIVMGVAVIRVENNDGSGGVLTLRRQCVSGGRAPVIACRSDGLAGAGIAFGFHRPRNEDSLLTFADTGHRDRVWVLHVFICLDSDCGVLFRTAVLEHVYVVDASKEVCHGCASEAIPCCTAWAVSPAIVSTCVSAQRVHGLPFDHCTRPFCLCNLCNYCSGSVGDSDHQVFFDHKHGIFRAVGADVVWLLNGELYWVQSHHVFTLAACESRRHEATRPCCQNKGPHLLWLSRQSKLQRKD